MYRYIFFNFGSEKPWIRIGIQPKMLDPDPDSMNLDLKLCCAAMWVTENNTRVPEDPYFFCSNCYKGRIGSDAFQRVVRLEVP